ncbi:MAG: 1-acyl-sn-glycerol-3-phosphate acyltransferase [Gemmatimonadales bacterium]
MRGPSRRDVMVYLSNHRSNMDYVVVSFVLAQSVSISYAVGEWAGPGRSNTCSKSFGSYFVRRNFRDPLYHLVLERYVQPITRNRVTQGLFPEGGLTRDGTLRPPKIGLLDYLVGTLRDPGSTGSGSCRWRSTTTACSRIGRSPGSWTRQPRGDPGSGSWRGGWGSRSGTACSSSPAGANGTVRWPSRSARRFRCGTGSPRKRPPPSRRNGPSGSRPFSGSPST